MEKQYSMNRVFRTCFFLSVFCVVLCTSCSKLLEQKPQEAPYDQVFWKDSKDALQAISGDYSLLRKALTVNEMSYFAYGDLSTSEFTDFNDYAYNFLVKGDEYYSTGLNIADFIGDYLDGLQSWTPHYQTISYANTILEKASKIPVEKFSNYEGQKGKNKILGEAYFLRAFSYFYIVRLWGDVPLQTAYDLDPARALNIPRTNELIVLDTCINDLRRAISLLQWERLGTEKNIRANKGAAYALLADVYMWKYFLTKGTDASLLTNTVNAIDSITANNYSLVLMDKLPSLFAGQSDEGIFEVKTSVPEQQEASGFYYKTLIDPYIKGKTSKNGKLNTELIASLYNLSNDRRKDSYFDFNGSSSDPILAKYIGRNGENRFYKDATGLTGGAVNCNIIVYRLAGALLLRAEANARLGNNGAAIADINAVRARAGAPPFDLSAEPDLILAIVKEKWREFFCEGTIWYDLIRTQTLPVLVPKFPMDRYTQQGWKWPVSRALFLNNKFMVQNSYWQSLVK